MKIFKKTITLIIFILTSATQINTLASSNINFNNTKINNVAVIFHRGDDPYMIRIRESLEDIQKENQNKIKFTFFDSQNNISIQNEIIDSAIKSNFDLLILNLRNKNEGDVENILHNVGQQNIPVILMNIPSEVVSKVSKLYNKVAFVASDSKQAGIAQGKILVDLWNSNKKILDKNGDNILQYVLLQGKADDPQAINRTKHALSTINDSGIKTEQLELIPAGWLKDLAKLSVNNIFLRYNGKIEAIISNNDVMAIGAIEALQKYGYNTGDESKYIVVVGTDGLPEAIDLIDKGLMSGTVIQDPKVAAKMFYTIGMNLINNLNPTENTNYKIVDEQIIIPYPYDAYIGKSNTPK